MKKLLSTISALLIGVSLVACSEKKEQVHYYDNDYVQAVKMGLERRIKIVDGDEYKNAQSPNEKDLIVLKGVKEELNTVNGFKDKTFNNPELKKIAQDYEKALTIQSENLPINNDLDKSKAFKDAYNDRTKIIITLIDKYGLKIDRNIETEFRQNANSVTKKDNVESKLIDALKASEFKKLEQQHYGANIKNTTGEKLGNLIINFKLIDKDGVTIGTGQYANTTEWAPDEVKSIDFYTTSKKNFEKIEFSIQQL